MYVCVYIYIYIYYIYQYIWRSAVETLVETAWPRFSAPQSCNDLGPLLHRPVLYSQSPCSHCGFPRVRLEHNLKFKGWNSHVQRDFLGIFPESLTQAMLVRTMLVGRLGVFPTGWALDHNLILYVIFYIKFYIPYWGGPI